MQAFKLWCTSTNKSSPYEVLTKVLLGASHELYGVASSLAQLLNISFKSTPSLPSLGEDIVEMNLSNQFHHRLLDLIMYEDKYLVEESLQLLMVKINKKFSNFSIRLMCVNDICRDMIIRPTFSSILLLTLKLWGQ